MALRSSAPVPGTADWHRRLRAVFDEALLQPPSAREAYIDRACAGDPDLGPEVTNGLRRALAREADAWMAGQNIGNPARMTGMLAPGFPDVG